jgi:putative membrane protein
MRNKFAWVVALMFLATPLFAQIKETEFQPPQPLSSQDKEFLSMAAQGNLAEIEQALLAGQRADNLAVKAFSRLMVDDHTMIGSHLALLLNAEKFQAPTGIGEEGQKTMSQLNSLSGANLDSKYMQLQVKEHEQVLNKFKEAEAKTASADVRRYVLTTYPILEEHLALAKAVDASLTEASKRAKR